MKLVYLILIIVAVTYCSSDITFIVLGDWGRDGQQNQTEVATAMGKWCMTKGPCNFIISVGDNMYDYGVVSQDSKQFDTSFENIYIHPGLEGIKWYLGLGNHDYRGNPQAQVLYSKRSKRWYMPYNFFNETFELQNIKNARGKTINMLKTVSSGSLREDEERDVIVRMKMVILDTNPLIQRYWTDKKMNQTAIKTFNATKQLQFYENAMSDAQDEWRIIVGHHPMYSAGRHGDNNDIIKVYQQRFQKDKASIYFSGHDHSLQHLFNPQFNRTHHIVCGAGSKVKFDVTKHEFLKEYQQESGFCFVRVSTDEIVTTFVNLRGEQTSQFIITKYL
jgi:tartrate-resistant acid phosphatase type 5